MVDIFLTVALFAAILTVFTKALSYIFEVMDDFFPFTKKWYIASNICETLSEFLFAGGVLTLIVAALIYLIGG